MVTVVLKLEQVVHGASEPLERDVQVDFVAIGVGDDKGSGVTGDGEGGY